MIKAALRSALLVRVTAPATVLTIWSHSRYGKDPAIPATGQSSMNADSRLEKNTNTSLIGSYTNAVPPFTSDLRKNPARCRCDAHQAEQQ